MCFGIANLKEEACLFLFKISLRGFSSAFFVGKPIYQPHSFLSYLLYIFYVIEVAKRNIKKNAKKWQISEEKNN